MSGYFLLDPDVKMRCPWMQYARESSCFLDPACDRLHNSDSMELKLAVSCDSGKSLSMTLLLLSFLLHFFTNVMFFPFLKST